jgi:hypothetical protein
VFLKLSPSDRKFNLLGKESEIYKIMSEENTTDQNQTNQTPRFRFYFSGPSGIDSIQTNDVEVFRELIRTIPKSSPAEEKSE